MSNLKGSKTEINLLAAFAGESQARNRYTFGSSLARKSGYIKLANILEETANQEKEHAKRLFSFLEGGEVQITGSFPAGLANDLSAHLTAAAAGEHYEWSEMYPSFAQTATEEGFKDIAAVFQNIAIAEKYHEKRFLKYLELLKEGKYFKKDHTVTWRCLNCGFIHEGAEAPGKCPACAHLKEYFEVICCH